VGETGCMVRANLPPMELFDVKYSLGSGLGMGMGLAQSDPAHHVVTLVGDSSFFHSDINAMPYVAQFRPPMTVIVLDNGTTALTGGQAHPGSATDERGEKREQVVDLVDVIAGCGVRPDLYAPDDRAALDAAIDAALETRELRVIIVRGPCPRYLAGG
ncbi:MAG: indolepyruvate ferredoxin oxidoreductase subunit alpha, partial [Anaerolineae bacterium]|nr:indolepyruvate ferredoxin oxidoreductase subunit alpha [Anaerolineae bacterium]